MRDYIKNALSMEDIFYRYGIKHNKKTCNCPFHNDKNPSMIFDKNGFKCFGCGKKGDIISFVEYLYNLDFKQAMQKINEDFNLGLNSNTKIDYEKIKKLQEEKKQKERYKNKLMKEYCKLCNKHILLEKERKFLLNRISLINIDEMLKLESKFRDMQWEVEEEIENINKKMAII